MVVILSTHIVDDVTDLCPNMAVLSDGKIVSKGTPKQLIQQLDGMIWKKVIDKSQLDDYSTKHHLISHHLSAGKRIIRVKSKIQPEIGFESTAVNLEDVYFLAIDENRNSDEINNDNSINHKPTKIVA